MMGVSFFLGTFSIGEKIGTSRIFSGANCSFLKDPKKKLP